jgi:membrane protease YdiL (CAAX protease family)
MLVVGSIAYVIAVLVTGFVNQDLVELEEMMITDPLVDFYLYHIVNIFTVIGMWIAARAILKRKLISFITPNERVNWSKIGYGFCIAFLLFAVFAVLDYAIFPNDYALNDFDGTRFAWLVVASVLLVPIQTTSEELLFRGFLLQWAGKLTKNPIILMLIIGGIFQS